MNVADQAGDYVRCTQCPVRCVSISVCRPTNDRSRRSYGAMICSGGRSAEGPRGHTQLAARPAVKGSAPSGVDLAAVARCRAAASPQLHGPTAPGVLPLEINNQAPRWRATAGCWRLTDSHLWWPGSGGARTHWHGLNSLAHL